jgi:hypothetical protein
MKINFIMDLIETLRRRYQDDLEEVTVTTISK